ncbi:DUF1272 domain-containing protein [Brevibacillus sp. NRS-1366]|uniref:DUF1272 domain-containing protein n=1 Tax=Brevibacillus sp. NRS-1366 TaxID=3233899 RepID=UPI003D250800
MLEMRDRCEKCQKQVEPNQEAYICSYECTFCKDCTNEMNATCPNCTGELVRRPRRKVA